MPAKSLKQRKFFGIVRGLQKGTVKASDVGEKAVKASRSVSVKSAKKFAKTKEKGLPEKVGKKKRRMSSDGVMYS